MSLGTSRLPPRETLERARPHSLSPGLLVSVVVPRGNGTDRRNSSVFTGRFQHYAKWLFNTAHRCHREWFSARGDGGRRQRAQRAVRLDAVLRDVVAIEVRDVRELTRRVHRDGKRVIVGGDGAACSARPSRATSTAHAAIAARAACSARPSRATSAAHAAIAARAAAPRTPSRSC